MFRMFSSAHVLTVNSTVRKKQKQKQKASSKSNSIRIRHIREQVLLSIRKSPKAWAWSDKSTFLYPAQFPRQSGKVLSSNILMCVEKSLLMDNAQKIIWNAYEKTHKLISSFIHDELRWISWWTHMKIIKNEQHFEVFSRT